MIDNASSDGVPEAVARAYEHELRLTVIFNHANLGFGPAVNRAAKQATGDTLLVLNPDCLLEADTLSQLTAVLREQSRVGLVGAVVCDAQGRARSGVAPARPAVWRGAQHAVRRDGEGVNVAGPCRPRWSTPRRYPVR